MSTILKTAAAYWFLLLVARVVPRRSGSISTPFELILFVLFGGLAVQGVLGNDHSFFNSLLALSTVALMHLLAASLKQWFPSFGKVVDGTPVIVIDHSCWRDDAMNQLRIQPQDVMQAARQRGIAQRSKIHRAIVERNGSVSIITGEEEEHDE